MLNHDMGDETYLLASLIGIKLHVHENITNYSILSMLLRCIVIHINLHQRVFEGQMLTP